MTNINTTVYTVISKDTSDEAFKEGMVKVEEASAGTEISALILCIVGRFIVTSDIVIRILLLHLHSR